MLRSGNGKQMRSGARSIVHVHLSLALAGVLAGVFAVACGGASFDGATYRNENVAFRVPRPPAGWEPLDISHGALAYRDREHDAIIAVNGRCGVDDEDVPLASLTHHLFLQFTDRSIRTQEVVPFNGREAMHSELSAKLDGVPKMFDVWVLKKDGCVYDLVLIAPPASFDAGLGQFHTFVRGFTALPTDGD